jgi:hypothetical protein
MQACLHQRTTGIDPAGDSLTEGPLCAKSDNGLVGMLLVLFASAGLEARTILPVSYFLQRLVRHDASTPLLSGRLGRAKRRQGCPVESHRARNELQLLVRRTKIDSHVFYRGRKDKKMDVPFLFSAANVYARVATVSR